MKIKFYGVRGSYPVPSKDTIKYGGNTTCVSVEKEIDGKITRVIIDSGTGAIKLGKDILNNYFQKKENLSLPILYTHLHPDHTQAFPFFSPNYFPQCEMHLMGMKTLKKHVGTVLEQAMLPPTFPIEYKDLKSNRIHYELKDGQSIYIHSDNKAPSPKPTEAKGKPVFKISVMQAYAPSHPQQGALYFIVEDLETEKRVACVWDLESKLGGDKAVINFVKDCDIIIHDTQYTTEEYQDDEMIVQGFGHSTYEMAMNNAKQAGIKGKLICTHFNPVHSDDRLDEIGKWVSEESKNYNFDIVLAKEGMEIEV